MSTIDDVIDGLRDRREPDPWPHADGPFPAGMREAWEGLLPYCTIESVFDDPVVFPLQRVREMDAMTAVAAEVSPTGLLDIGSDKCGGLLCWLRRLPSLKRVCSVEVRGHPCKDLFEASFPDIEFLWVEGSSYEPKNAMDIQNWFLDTAPEVTFFDGDKGGILKDFMRHWRRWDRIHKKPARLFVHDICDPVPREGWEKIKDMLAGLPAMFAASEIVDFSEAREAVQRQHAGVPATSEHENWLRHWGERSCGVGVMSFSGRNE